ncbi:MAG: hypothetical protein U0Y82_07160 [Thermoleophilia bacterium]
MSLLDTTDKVFWHGYVDFYEPFLASLDVRHVAEFGVFRGNSIRWLLDRFPDALIDGADILPWQPEWPVDPRFRFTQLDQGDPHAVRRFLERERFDLIIEDGSHHPHHQVSCLLEGMRVLAPGGVYILEDAHTSHPSYPQGHLDPPPDARGNALTVLLALDHMRRIGLPVDHAAAAAIAEGSLLSPGEVADLARTVAAVHLYRRTHLPDSCWACGGHDYDFSALRCRCGVEVFADGDSMSFVIVAGGAGDE